MNTQNLITREYVRIAPNRSKVMLCLGDGGAMTPTAISLEIDKKVQLVYRSIKELESKNLIYQTNAPKYRNKLYALTPYGQYIYEIFDMNIPSRMIKD